MNDKYFMGLSLSEEIFTYVRLKEGEKLVIILKEVYLYLFVAYDRVDFY